MNYDTMIEEISRLILEWEKIYEERTNIRYVITIGDLHHIISIHRIVENKEEEWFLFIKGYLDYNIISYKKFLLSYNNDKLQYLTNDKMNIP